MSSCVPTNAPAYPRPVPLSSIGLPRSTRKGIKFKLPGDMGCKSLDPFPVRSAPRSTHRAIGAARGAPSPLAGSARATHTQTLDTSCHTHACCMPPPSCHISPPVSPHARLVPHLHSRSRPPSSSAHRFTRYQHANSLAQHQTCNLNQLNIHFRLRTLSRINCHHVAYFIPFPISDIAAVVCVYYECCR